MNAKVCILSLFAIACATACGGKGNSSNQNSGGVSISSGTTGSGGSTGGASGGTTAGGTTGVNPGDTSGDPNLYPQGVSAPTTAGGQPVDDGVIPTPNRTDWLTVKGNQILTASGTPWVGRGITLHDTRSCDFCTSHPPNIAELKRRIDVAVSTWHVNFFRFLLQSFATAAFPDGSGNRTQWIPIDQDPQAVTYVHDIREIVEYIGTKPGVFVEVSMWEDPNLTTSGDPTTQQAGLPSQETDNEMATLAGYFANDAHVMFGVSNEPEEYTDALEPVCQAAMSLAVQTIRAKETGKHHLIAVQGTEGWARLITYYVDNPVAGDNVVYETHPYTATANFQTDVFEPHQTLPVIIGEFAPASDAGMTQQDCMNLIQQADAANIPWTAWDFHTHCIGEHGNNMLLNPNDVNGNELKCVYGVALTPTDWGTAIYSYIRSKQ